MKVTAGLFSLVLFPNHTQKSTKNRVDTHSQDQSTQRLMRTPSTIKSSSVESMYSIKLQGLGMQNLIIYYYVLLCITL